MNAVQKVALSVVSLINATLVIFLVTYAAPARAGDLPPILDAIKVAVQDMTRIEIAPEFVMMTGDEIKFDACVHPQKCPDYVSVHPPMTDKILVTTDIDIAKDLSAQGQIAHVLTMYALEKAGQYSPGMSCKEVFALETYAHQISTAYVLEVQHEYEQAGHKPPMYGSPKIHSICGFAPPKPSPDEYF